MTLTIIDRVTAKIKIIDVISEEAQIALKKHPNRYIYDDLSYNENEIYWVLSEKEPSIRHLEV